jgi:drug/metabolite transporter (DMT)-like permease
VSRNAAREAGLCFLGANLLWGSTYVVAAGVLEAAPPLVLAFVRFCIAGAVMLLLRSHAAPPSKQRSSPAGSERWALLVLGVVGFGLAKVMNYEGLARSTATDAALIINLEAVFTAYFGRLLLGQKLTRVQASGLALAFLGGLLLVWPNQPATASHPGFERALGNGLMVASVAAEALASVLGIRAMAAYTGMQVTAYGTYLGGLSLFPFAVWQSAQNRFDLSWVTPANVLGIAYLAIGATLVAYALWFRGLARADASRAAAYLYVQPMVGLALGILIRKEWPTLLGWSGGLLVLFGVAMAERISMGRLPESAVDKQDA